MWTRVQIFSTIGLKCFLWRLTKTDTHKKGKLGILVPPGQPHNGHGSIGKDLSSSFILYRLLSIFHAMHRLDVFPNQAPPIHSLQCPLFLRNIYPPNCFDPSLTPFEIFPQIPSFSQSVKTYKRPAFSWRLNKQWRIDDGEIPWPDITPNFAGTARVLGFSKARLFAPLESWNFPSFDASFIWFNFEKVL